MPLVLYHITVSNAVPFPDLRNQETRLDFLSPQEFEASTAVLKPLNDQLPTQEAMDYFQATADQLASHINEIDMSFLYVASKLFLFTLFVIPNFFFFFFIPQNSKTLFPSRSEPESCGTATLPLPVRVQHLSKDKPTS